MDKSKHLCESTKKREEQQGGSRPNLPSLPANNVFRLAESGHRGAIATYETSFTQDYQFLSDAYDSVNSHVQELINSYIDMYCNIRVKLTFYLKLREIKTGNVVYRYFNSPFMMTTHRSFVSGTTEFCLNSILNQLNLFNNEKSGCTLIFVENLLVGLMAVRTYC